MALHFKLVNNLLINVNIVIGKQNALYYICGIFIIDTNDYV